MKYVIKHCDTPNVNGIIFTKDCLKTIYEKIKDLPEIIGVLEGGMDFDGYDLRKAVCTVKDLSIDSDGNLIGDVTFLETRHGMAIKQYADEGKQIQFGLVGNGHLNENFEVIPDMYKLTCIHVSVRGVV